MHTKALIVATSLAVISVVQWLPATAGAATPDVPTACITTSPAAGAEGELGPKGDKGPKGDPGTDATPPTQPPGPSRQAHRATDEVGLPTCEDIEGLCIIRIPGEKGPIGPKGEQGDKGETGPDGTYYDGPSRNPHSLTGADPCAGVDEVCRITIYGRDGDEGPQGDKGDQGDQGDPGKNYYVDGPARAPHPSSQDLQRVNISAECQVHLASLSPDGGGLPSTGTTSGALAATAAALLALGASALLVRRRTAI